MIGIDPHKASHTAVAINVAEDPLGQLRVRACSAQAEQLLAWAQAWPERTWAVEGAGGLGHLLAQQLLAAGEQVLDVPPKLSARVRLLEAGDTNNNDPNDARPVAVAALRSRGVREAGGDDHAAVLKVWSKRHRDLGRARTQVACRLHAVLRAGPRRCLQGDHRRPGRSSPGVDHAGRSRGGGPLRARRRVHRGSARHRRGDPRHPQEARRHGAGGRDQPDRAVRSWPVIAAAVIGDARQVSRFPNRDHVAAYDGTAPIEVSSGGQKIYRLSRRGHRRLNHAIHMAAVTQIRHPGSQGPAYYDKKLAEGKTRKEALRALKRQVSDAIFACLQAGARQAAAAQVKDPGG